MTEPSVVHLTELETPVGEMLAAANDTHLLLFDFKRRRMIDTQLERVRRAMRCSFVSGESPVFAQLREELGEYFRGERTEFSVPLDVPGTPFQTQVWDTLRRIPCGATTTYARLAESIGQPSAVRAVARANGDNRIAIIIPCHRVIGSDGQLVGYGGGLSRKRQLLNLEARTLTMPLFEPSH
jgi:AraC family transcriptional regulator of adaptative response/methylated-DNA-[protein]-cysteine methyltransferase